MDKQIRRIGVLTSGGDAPGMNALIRSGPQRAQTIFPCSRHSPRLQWSYQRGDIIEMGAQQWMINARAAPPAL